MTRDSRRATGAAAQVLPMLAVTLVGLVAVIALAVDLSGAWRVRQRQTQTLELAKESVMTSLNAVKFSDVPAGEVLQLTLDAFARDGYDASEGLTSDVTLWYYEEPESATGAGNRLAVVTVQMHQSYDSILAWVVGKRSIDIADQLTWTINPYSTTKVWRPGATRSYRYDFTVSSHSLDISAPSVLTRGGLPETSRKALDDALRGLGRG